jgi:hypothetical protein
MLLINIWILIIFRDVLANTLSSSIPITALSAKAQLLHLMTFDTFVLGLTKIKITPNSM